MIYTKNLIFDNIEVNLFATEIHIVDSKAYSQKDQYFRRDSHQNFSYNFQLKRWLFAFHVRLIKIS